MTTYTVDLSPVLKNPNQEGFLDTALDSNGNSIQRTMYVELSVSSTQKRVFSRSAIDGAVISDVLSTPTTYWADLV